MAHANPVTPLVHHALMTTNELFPTPIDADGTRATDTPTSTSSTPSATEPTPADGTGQLRLLDTSDLPLQFRLDKATRERGLAHVAELRRRLGSRPSPWAA